MNANRTIRAALFRLGKVLDLDVLDLPITIDPNLIEPITYTDNTGIIVGQYLLDTDSRNLEVYLAHELFHYVVRPFELYNVFSAEVLNQAEDYCINYLLYLHYGLDTRKVKHKGLYNKKYANWSVYDIACDLPNVNSGRFASYHGHPYLIKLARHIQEKISYEPSERSLIINELGSDFYRAISKNYSATFANLTSINPELAINCLWSRFYELPKWNHAALGKTLTHTQALILSPKIDNELTYGDENLSLFFTMTILDVLNRRNELISLKLNKAKLTLTKLFAKGDDLRGKKRTKKVKRLLEKNQARINSTTLRIDKLKLLFSQFELYTLPTEAIVKPARSSNTDLLNTKIENVSPRFHASSIVKYTRTVLKMFFHPDQAIELYEQLQSLTNNFAEEQEIKDEHEGGNSKSSDKDNTSDLDTEEQGSVGRPSTKLVVLNTLHANPNIFRDMLRVAQEIGEKLVRTTALTISENSILDRTLTLGNDLSRASQSDLGRLGCLQTKLSFLVDLANSNLLQYVDKDPRRSPLIFVLDCSGSMHGKAYRMAAGFCLAMIKKLQEANQGCALIKFSSDVDKTFIWDGQKVDLAKLILCLAKPSYSGTNFDNALLSAFSIHKKQGWNKSQILLITDGGDNINLPTMGQKPDNCKITAVLINQRRHLDHADEVINVRVNNLQLELTKIGNKVL